MLTKIKKRVYRALYEYYYTMAEYCYGKLDERRPEHNDYWGMKAAKYTAREFKMIDKLIQMEET